MGYNPGLFKENQIVFKLDKAKVKDLGRQERHLLRSIYGELDDEEEVRCEIVDNYQKPDFYLIYKGDKKYVSFKTGKTVTIHQEYLDSFIMYLKELKIPQETIDDFFFFFYRDGTYDGSGGEKIVMKELVEANPEKADKFNAVINTNKKVVTAVVDRLLFKGREDTNISAEYICYWREKDAPIVVNKKQIMHHIEKRDWDYMDNPHIGPFQFRPHILYAKGDAYRDKYHKRIDFWWSNLLSDLEYISMFYRK